MFVQYVGHKLNFATEAHILKIIVGFGGFFLAHFHVKLIRLIPWLKLFACKSEQIAHR